MPVWLTNVMSSVGTTLVTIFFVSVIHDSQDMKEYFSERIRDIIVKNEYLDKLGIKELKSLRGTINSTLRRIAGDAGDDAPIDALYDELDLLMRRCWISKQKIVVYIEEDSDHIKKIVRSETSYQTRTDGCCEEKCLRPVKMKKISSIPREDHFKLTKFSVEKNGSDVGVRLTNDDFFIRDTLEGEEGVYDIVVQCDKTFEISDKVTVICETVRRVPKSDKTHLLYIRYPCAELEASFTYTGNRSINMSGTGFCNNFDSKVKAELTHDRKGLEITMGPGILPGSGVVMFFDLLDNPSL